MGTLHCWITPCEDILSVVYIYSGAVALPIGTYFDRYSPALIDNLDCVGNETSILNCTYSTTSGTCRDAPIICQGLYEVWVINLLVYLFLFFPFPPVQMTQQSPTALMVRSDWSVVQLHWKEQWRSAGIWSGEEFVTTRGTFMMQTWCALSLDSALMVHIHLVAEFALLTRMHAVMF